LLAADENFEYLYESFEKKKTKQNEKKNQNEKMRKIFIRIFFYKKNLLKIEI